MIRFASTVLQVSHEGAADGFLHREDLLVDRLADDDGEGARLDRLVEILQLRHAARGDHRTGGDAAGEARRRRQVRPRAHAVAADVGVQDGRGAGARHRLADVQRADGRGLLPALDRHHPFARVDGDHDAPGKLRAGRLDDLGRLDGGGAGHGVLRPQIEPALAVRDGAYAAAHLDLGRGRADDLADGVVVVLRAAAEGGVQIDDVDARGAGGREARGDLPRAVRVDGGAGAVALAQADGLAAQKIDCGKYQHGARLIPPLQPAMKADSSAAPASWLFSGWNWQAKTLSRATAEQKVSPCSVSRAMSWGRDGTAKKLCTK